MKTYLSQLRNILKDGVDTKDRTGVGTRSINGSIMKFKMKDGFPAVTTKKLAWNAVKSELFWFLEGNSDERRLAELLYNTDRFSIVDKKTIWTANADNQGVKLGYQNDDFVKQLGPIYGVQWRNFNGAGIDQIQNLIDQIIEVKNNPDAPCGRRMIVSAWNPLQIDEMALPPCHTFFQCILTNGVLDLIFYQRSEDMFLGKPFNIASYALLLEILAQITGTIPGTLTSMGGNSHIYLNHIEQVETQLKRKPFKLPTLKMPNFTNLDELLECNISDFVLEKYKFHESIKAPMAV